MSRTHVARTTVTRRAGRDRPKEERRTNQEELSPEPVDIAEACGNVEELTALAKAEGIELTDEQLDEVRAPTRVPSVHPVSKMQ